MEKVIMKTTHTATGYCCMCDLLPGWTTSHGHDFRKFDKYVRESIDFYVDCAKKNGDEYPEVLDGEYEIEYQFDVPALLHYYQGTLSFSGLQRITGVNQKQLAHYASGRSRPMKRQAMKIVEGIHAFANELNGLSINV